MAMAFLIPVILLNEMLLKWTRQYIQNFARNFGAEDEDIASETLDAG
jgi:hypothetical protein